MHGGGQLEGRRESAGQQQAGKAPGVSTLRQEFSIRPARALRAHLCNIRGMRTIFAPTGMSPPRSGRGGIALTLMGLVCVLSSTAPAVSLLIAASVAASGCAKLRMPDRLLRARRAMRRMGQD